MGKIDPAKAKTASVKQTRRIHSAQERIEDASARRRHFMRLANDGGVTYAELAEANDVSPSVVGEAIARAREEAEGGQVPMGLTKGL